MDKYFNLTLVHKEKINKYNQKLDLLNLRIDNLKGQLNELSNRLISENQYMSELTKSKERDNIESYNMGVSIVIFLISLIAFIFYVTGNVEILETMIRIAKGLFCFTIVNGISFLLNKFISIKIKKYYDRITEENKELISKQEEVISRLRSKISIVTKNKSSLVEQKREIERKIRKEQDYIENVNKILLEELSPYLDELIIKEINQGDQNIKIAMDNISRKLSLNDITLEE